MKAFRTAIRRTAFLARWYVMYNARLMLLNDALPENGEAPCLSEDIASALDKKRRKAQAAIYSKIANHKSPCAECRGRCCLEEVDRYTAFDQAIHSGVGSPLEKYGGKIYSPSWMISGGLRRTFLRKVGADKTAPPCRHLSPAGCTIDKELRPMLCASWFCPTYIRALSAEELEELAEDIAEIEAVHREVHKIASSLRSSQ